MYNSIITRLEEIMNYQKHRSSMRTRFVGSGDLIDVDMVFGSVSAQGSRSRPEDLRVTQTLDGNQQRQDPTLLSIEYVCGCSYTSSPLFPKYSSLNSPPSLKRASSTNLC